MKCIQILLFVAVSCFALSLPAQSVPPLINYQGRLTDAAGGALPDGQYRVAFRLWDDSAASSTNAPTHLIWGREYDVTLIQGAFNGILGGGGVAVIPGAATNEMGFAFSSSNRFLGLTITRNLSGDIVPNQQREILPRQQILSAPFALSAQQAQQAQQATVANALVKDLADALCPPGSIMPFGGKLVPDGWLLCDGSARSSAAFPRLFANISTNWGTGIPASTNDFNLPDLRGLFLRGVDPIGGNDPDYLSRTNRSGLQSATVGSLQSDSFKSHTHPVADTGPTGIIQGGPAHVIQSSAPVSVSSLIGFAGGSETRPKNAYVNYIIKY